MQADAAAVFTPGIYMTRPGDLITFVWFAVIPMTDASPVAITNPAIPAKYAYRIPEIPQGLQAEFRLAQDNAGNATNIVDATLVTLE